MKVYFLKERNLTDSAVEIGKMLFPKAICERLSKKSGKSKQRSALAYLFLKYCLEKEGKGEYFDKVRFTSKGKPYADGIELSLSHTAGTIACVVSENKVGVDVEQIREIPLYAQKRFLDEQTLEKIKNEENGNYLALEQWVIKEAWLKQKGKGISVKLKKIVPSRLSDKLWKIDSDRIGVFKEDDFVLAVASEKGIPTKITQVKARDIL